MIFEKPSTRTRISFELADETIGWKLLVLNPKESHYGSGDESFTILQKFYLSMVIL